MSELTKKFKLSKFEIQDNFLQGTFIKIEAWVMVDRSEAKEFHEQVQNLISSGAESVETNLNINESSVTVRLPAPKVLR